MTSIGRAGVMIGTGTMVSRLTGFVRTMVLVAALGSTGSRAADAFATANGLPNTIYTIVSTGLLTAVIVPQIVKAATHSDRGMRFISKLFTLGAVILLGATLLAVALAPVLVELYARHYPPDQQALAVAFAYWCLPQILFYGLYALVGETLNARNIYGPYTWSPIANNVISIAGFGVFIALFGLRQDVVGWTGGMVTLVGGTSTVGVAVQALLLFAFWRKTGLKIRLDFRWRGVGLGQVGTLAGWTFLMVIAGQVAGLIQANLLSAASGHGPAAATFGYMWLLYMLPYSVIVLSIGTPYFTRLSEHAHAGHLDAVRSDIDASIRTVGFFIVISTAAVAAAAAPASRIFTNDTAGALQAAPLLWCMLAGLIPNAVQFTIQRTFYAFDDTRTPFLFTLAQTAVVIVTAYLSFWLLPPEWMAAGMALGQSLAAFVQLGLATWLLHRKIGTLHVGSWMPALLRFAAAAVPAGLAGWGTFLLLGGAGGWMLSSMVLGGVGTAVICSVSLVVYVLVLALVRAPELGPALQVMQRFVRR